MGELETLPAEPQNALRLVEDEKLGWLIALICTWLFWSRFAVNLNSLSTKLLPHAASSCPTSAIHIPHTWSLSRTTLILFCVLVCCLTQSYSFNLENGCTPACVQDKESYCVLEFDKPLCMSCNTVCSPYYPQGASECKEYCFDYLADALLSSGSTPSSQPSTPSSQSSSPSSQSSSPSSQSSTSAVSSMTVISVAGSYSWVVVLCIVCFIVVGVPLAVAIYRKKCPNKAKVNQAQSESQSGMKKFGGVQESGCDMPCRQEFRDEGSDGSTTPDSQRIQIQDPVPVHDDSPNSEFALITDQSQVYRSGIHAEGEGIFSN